MPDTSINTTATIPTYSSIDSNTGQAKQEGPEPVLSDLSISTILWDMMRFRGSALRDDSIYDFPSHQYFRILFHFDNGSDLTPQTPGAISQDSTFTGLLGPVWSKYSSQSTDQSKSIFDQAQQDLDYIWANNTAWSYFVMNDDERRATAVQNFVELLSQINSVSPWYFQAIKGLDEAINRPAVGSEDFTISTEKKKLTIECLEDSYDQRIGTLLDLYRSFVWSWETKREMLPVNLRKFDMTIILVQVPVKGLGVPRSKFVLNSNKVARADKYNIGIVPEGDWSSIYYNGTANPENILSFKAYEFHGCEIDYNSSKSGAADINVVEGTQTKYNIEISYDDMYESRYNQFLGELIQDEMGDNDYVYTNDSMGRYVYKSSEPKITSPDYTAPETSGDGSGRYERTDFFTGETTDVRNGDIWEDGTLWNNELERRNVGEKWNRSIRYNIDNNGILNQLVGRYVTEGVSKLKKIYLGNLYDWSLSRIKSQIGQALSGDLWGTVNNIKGYTTKNWDGGEHQLSENIFKESQVDVDQIKNLGNIFNSRKTLNSI